MKTKIKFLVYPLAVILISLFVIVGCSDDDDDENLTGLGNTGTFTDPRDGKKYRTVRIGNQVWMAENLNFHADGSYCYDNNDEYCQLYGRLYPWHSAMAGESSSSSNPSGVQGACPPGWHLPSEAEWTELINHVINKDYPNEENNPNGAGNALKSCRQVDSPLVGDCDTSEHPRWNSHSTHYGFDEFGFSALPGGYRWPSGSFNFVGGYGYWWSATEYSGTYAWNRGMYSFGGSVSRGYGSKTFGFSLRCVRDLD